MGRFDGKIAAITPRHIRGNVLVPGLHSLSQTKRAANGLPMSTLRKPEPAASPIATEYIDMSRERNIEIAKTMLDGIGTGRDPDAIAALFAENLVFEIQGDERVMPWVGHKTGRKAMAEFIRDQRVMTEPLAFDVEDVLASEKRAVVVGTLQTRIKGTGKIVATQFALVLTIVSDVVTRFQMLEDSYSVSRAARA